MTHGVMARRCDGTAWWHALRQT